MCWSSAAGPAPCVPHRLEVAEQDLRRRPASPPSRRASRPLPTRAPASSVMPENPGRAEALPRLGPVGKCSLIDPAPAVDADAAGGPRSGRAAREPERDRTPPSCGRHDHPLQIAASQRPRRSSTTSAKEYPVSGRSERRGRAGRGEHPAPRAEPRRATRSHQRRCSQPVEGQDRPAAARVLAHRGRCWVPQSTRYSRTPGHSASTRFSGPPACRRRLPVDGDAPEPGTMPARSAHVTRIAWPRLPRRIRDHGRRVLVGPRPICQTAHLTYPLGTRKLEGGG